MPNAFAVQEAEISGDEYLYWNLREREVERLEEEGRFHELQIHFGLRALAYYTSSGAWPTNSNLPDEIFIHIFSYLDSLQIMKTRLVNRSFRNMVYYSPNMAPLLPKLIIEFSDSGRGDGYDQHKSRVTVSTDVRSGDLVQAKGISRLSVNLSEYINDEGDDVLSLNYLGQNLGDSVVDLSIRRLQCTTVATFHDLIDVFELFTAATKVKLRSWSAKPKFTMPLVGLFQQITHLDLEISDEEGFDDGDNSSFMHFAHLSSTLRELVFRVEDDGERSIEEVTSAIYGISKLANLTKLDFGHHALVLHGHGNPENVNKLFEAFAKMIGKLVNLEDLTLRDFSVYNLVQSTSSYLLAKNQVMNVGPIKRITICLELRLHLTAYKKLVESLCTLFPRLQELVIMKCTRSCWWDRDSIDFELPAEAGLLLDQMVNGLSELRNHGTPLATISFLEYPLEKYYYSYKHVKTVQVSKLKELEDRLGGKIKVSLQK